jgi:5-methylcytosine-specific restriction endonuclease McrA
MARTARICTEPGCAVIVVAEHWCDVHKRAPWAGSIRNQRNPIGWAKIRAHVLRRDNNVCQYCGDVATEVDHVVPVSRGGSHKTNNLVASCKTCNAKKNIAQRVQRT